MKYVAIAGSSESREWFTPSITDGAAAARAAEAIGAALAKRGYGIIVYSAEERYIERHVVRGYLNSGRAGKRSILVRFGSEQAEPTFPDVDDARHAGVVVPQRDTSAGWEVSYYRSLAESAGILLIGGGNPTLATGLVAMSLGIPVLSIRRYGGGAQRAWEASQGCETIDGEDRQAMAEDCTRAENAERVVDSLERQRKRLEARKAHSHPGFVPLALVALGVVALAAWPLWLSIQAQYASVASAVFPACLLCSSAIAGVSGAAVAHLGTRAQARHGRGLALHAVLGAVAGGLSGALYLVGQFIGEASVDGPPLLLLLTAIVGFIGGLTTDAVFARLSGMSAVPQEVPGIRASNASEPPAPAREI